MKPSAELIKALGVTIEVVGAPTPSKGALNAMLADLACYPEQQVLDALRRCYRELKGRLSLSDIIERINDGRPLPDEAWAAIPKDEDASLVWTTEMRDAYAVARPLILLDDLVAARVAFLRKYEQIVQQSRDSRIPVEWHTTLGFDKGGRELALLDAAEKGRISVQTVRSLLPYHRDDEGLNARLLALEGRKPELPSPEGMKRMREVMGRFKALPAPKKAA